MREMQRVPTLLTNTDRSFPMRSSQVPSPVALLIIVASLATVAGCNHAHNADVVATVNGHAIMRADLDKAYQMQLGDAPQQRQLPQVRTRRHAPVHTPIENPMDRKRQFLRVVRDVVGNELDVMTASNQRLSESLDT